MTVAEPATFDVTLTLRDVLPDDGSWKVRVGGGVRIVGEGVFRVAIGD